MQIVKRLKDNQVLFSRKEEGVNELEGYTLLELNNEQCMQLFKVMTVFNVEHLLDGTLLATYTDEDMKKFNELWNKFFKEKGLDRDDALTKKYKPSTEGTSLLIRDDKRGEIRIGFRRDRDKVQTLSKVFINNRVREEFFHDCKQGTFYKATGRYAIDKSDKVRYDKWYSKMTQLFKAGLNK